MSTTNAMSDSVLQAEVGTLGNPIVGTRIRVFANYNHGPAPYGVKKLRLVVALPGDAAPVDRSGEVVTTAPGRYYWERLMQDPGDVYYKWTSADRGNEVVKEGTFKVTVAKR